MRSKSTIKDNIEKISAICAPLTVSSSGINSKEFLGPQYTCDGANFNPSLDISGIPKGTQSLAITMEDPDAPGGNFIHWIAWNIAVNSHIKEARPMEAEGINDFRMHGYRGPCPSYGTHHYVFNVYALDTLLDLHRDVREPELKAAMNGHILGFGRLTGLYKRK
ncbi:MAG: YbhB/YbcL family Raf kinase inhibitor-like protein [Sphingobacteriales bacterium]|nr:YbhB/YbcL family Raf kinase inhibitor-like protein [Sphingobacteriales bacterium]